MKNWVNFFKQPRTPNQWLPQIWIEEAYISASDGTMALLFLCRLNHWLNQSAGEKYGHPPSTSWYLSFFTAGSSIEVKHILSNYQKVIWENGQICIPSHILFDKPHRIIIEFVLHQDQFCKFAIQPAPFTKNWNDL